MNRATAYTLLAAALWGASFPAIRVGLEQGDAGPLTFAYLRFLLATLILLPFVVATGRMRWELLFEPPLWGLAALNAIGYSTQFLAQELTTASKTSLLVDINVVAVALLGVLFLRERHGKEVLAALALGALGVVLLSTAGDVENARLANAEFVGDLLALLAGLVWAFYFVGLKAYVDRRPGTDGLSLTFAVLAPTTLLLFVPAWSLEGLAEAGNATAWTMIAFLSLFSTVLAFYLWQEALRTQGATVTAILLLLEVVVALAISIGFLDERLQGWSIVGAVLVVAAAYLAARGPRGAKVAD